MSTLYADDPGAASFAHHRAWLLVILAAALLLRVWGLQDQSLSSDEIVEASIARLDAQEIVAYPDGFPPLYHLLLAGWLRAFPAPEMGRCLSVLAGMATVYAVFRWARHSAGDAAGLFAAGLLAVTPLHVYFSQEMRAYALYLCLAGFALMFFFEALTTNRAKSWLGFVASAALAVNTHYYAALMAALLGGVLLFSRPAWTTMRRGLLAFTALACCSLPAMALLPGDVAYQSDGFAAKAPLLATLGHTAYAFFAGYSLGPSLAELHVLPMREAAAEAAPWILALGAIGGLLLWHGWQELRRQPLGIAIIFLAVASAPIIGFAGSLADVGPKVRYWAWILLPVIVWLAAGVARGWHTRSGRITQAAFVALVSIQLFAIASRHANPRYANEDIRRAAEYLQQDPSRKAPVFVVSDYMAPPVRYYLNGERTLDNWLPYLSHEPRALYEPGGEASAPLPWLVHPRSEDEVRGSAPLDDAALAEWLATVKSLAGEDGRFWLIYSRAFHGDLQAKMLSYLNEHSWIAHEREFSGVVLYRGRTPRAN